MMKLFAKTKTLIKRFLAEKVTKKTLLGISLASIAWEVYLGMVFGYFLGKFFSGHWKGQPQLIKSIVFNVGKYRVHLHHWLTGLGILIFALWYQFLPFPQFSLGFLGGLIFQDIHLDRGWYRILSKEK